MAICCPYEDDQRKTDPSTPLNPMQTIHGPLPCPRCPRHVFVSHKELVCIPHGLAVTFQFRNSKWDGIIQYLMPGIDSERPLSEAPKAGHSPCSLLPDPFSGLAPQCGGSSASGSGPG